MKLNTILHPWNSSSVLLVKVKIFSRVRNTLTFTNIEPELNFFSHLLNHSGRIKRRLCGQGYFEISIRTGEKKNRGKEGTHVLIVSTLMIFIKDKVGSLAPLHACISLTCCRAQCRVAKYGRKARGDFQHPRTPVGPRSACSPSRTGENNSTLSLLLSPGKSRFNHTCSTHKLVVMI